MMPEIKCLCCGEMYFGQPTPLQGEGFSVCVGVCPDCRKAAEMGRRAMAELPGIYKDIMDRRELKECWFTASSDPEADDYGDCFHAPTCLEECPLERLRKIKGE